MYFLNICYFFLCCYLLLQLLFKILIFYFYYLILTRIVQDYTVRWKWRVKEIFLLFLKELQDFLYKSNM